MEIAQTCLFPGLNSTNVFAYLTSLNAYHAIGVQEENIKYKGEYSKQIE